ncbi:MAG TPA: OmcA/MtrC family decaheme c-type cytochrome [Thermoanaerobaculia bacterium]|nr:OmcA/MtrC family decaheme c-type cytochrome [Thermoanaerobaculia bacterium]
MTAFLRALLVLATAGTIAFPTQPPPKLTAPETATNGGRKRAVGTPSTPVPSRPEFVATDLEYYLTDDGIAYIRPGLKVTIKSVTVPTDRKPVVEFTLTDNFDQPLDRLGKTTPGVVSTSWLLAWYNPETRLYTSYITRTVNAAAGSPKAGTSAVQATGENVAANYTDKGNGLYSYKFNAALPANFDVTKTHTLGVYSSRNLTEQIGKNYYADEEFDFRPDGQTVVEKWDKIRDVGSCQNCHDAQTFGLHGGSRRDVKLCVMCHTPQTTDPDTGNSVDMALMIHKIHGAALLSTPYVIWGNGNSIHDYSEVTYPQDTRNCKNCHEGTVATAIPTQKEVWYTQPSRRACGACHDSINWVTGEGHPAGPQTSDATCATCHVPDSGSEFDASVKGGHMIPTKSSQLQGIKATIVSVSNVKAGEKPTIVYKFTNNKGEVLDGTKFSTFAPIHAGPTSSYTTYFRESVTATSTNKAAFDAATGNTTYTFTNPIPAGSTGTWSFSGDFYITSTLKRGDGKADITGVRDAAINPQKYVGLNGATTVPRRTSVSIALCNECHDSLGLHGGQRRTIEECVMCHNPVKGDKAVRPATEGEEESVSFQRLIHRIHSGHELTQDFTVFGNGSSRHNYNEVTYPGDRRNCASCHVSDGQQLPAAGDPVIAKRDFFSPQGSGTAACLGCHDNRDAAAHAFLNTTTFGGQPAEACATCHGKTKEWSVDKSHAR